MDPDTNKDDKSLQDQGKGAFDGAEGAFNGAVEATGNAMNTTREKIHDVTKSQEQKEADKLMSQKIGDKMPNSAKEVCSSEESKIDETCRRWSSDDLYVLIDQEEPPPQSRRLPPVPISKSNDMFKSNSSSGPAPRGTRPKRRPPKREDVYNKSPDEPTPTPMMMMMSRLNDSYKTLDSPVREASGDTIHKVRQVDLGSINTSPMNKSPKVAPLKIPIRQLSRCLIFQVSSLDNDDDGEPEAEEQDTILATQLASDGMIHKARQFDLGSMRSSPMQKSHQVAPLKIPIRQLSRSLIFQVSPLDNDDDEEPEGEEQDTILAEQLATGDMIRRARQFDLGSMSSSPMQKSHQVAPLKIPIRQLSRSLIFQVSPLEDNDDEVPKAEVQDTMLEVLQLASVDTIHEEQ